MAVFCRVLGRAVNAPATLPVVLGVVALGLLVIVVQHAALVERFELDPEWARIVREVALALATAILTALLLMVLVDRPIKKAIERDVFRAVMGYLLPDAIRTELQWVYSMKVVCVRSRVGASTP